VKVLEHLKNNFLLFDGAMGTMLQNEGLRDGELPEVLNIEKPGIVSKIHRQYVLAGADVVTANTFGANSLKFKNQKYTVKEVILSGIKCAKESGAKYVAQDIGPTGALLEPMGTLTFEEAYDLYKEQVLIGKEAGVDLFIIETISDLYEAKAAILAAKENSGLPVFCTMTFEKDGRTFCGVDAVSAAVTLSSLGVDALGVNCSLGPKEILPVVETLAKYSKVPLIVQANAGLPKDLGGKTVYEITPEEYTNEIKKMADLGVRVFGGCCGTTPEFIKSMKNYLDTVKPKEIAPPGVSFATSGTKAVCLDGRTIVVGERLNPTGKKKLKEALVSNNMDYVAREAIEQAQHGADILDVNAGLPDIDEPKLLQKVIKEVQSVVNLPLQIDSSDPSAIEAAVRVYNGRPIINSVNGKKESMEKILPIVKKYGTLVVALTLDEGGIPKKAEERLNIAKKIIDEAEKYGISKEDIIVDALVLTVSAQQEEVLETLRAVKLIKEHLKVKTILGISNVSFGLPNRELINKTFLAAALGAGLDMAIINPMSPGMMGTISAYKVLSNEDKDAAGFIKKFASEEKREVKVVDNENTSLFDIIVQGRKDESAQKVSKMLDEGKDPLDIIENEFVGALNFVGEKFEKGEIFLPQLMQSAQAVKNAFVVISDFYQSRGVKREQKGKILLATVKGDIHDIGKNIVKMMLENYGYEVFDLGKDVDKSLIIETIKKENITLAGLSALMTTTVKSMKETIDEIRKENLPCKVMVGGAVLNEDYARFVGADYYAKDAQGAVQIAREFFKK